MDDGADSTKVELRMFQDRVMERLQEVKDTLEQRTTQMEEKVKAPPRVKERVRWGGL